MLEIGNDFSIKLTRGDTAYFEVEIKNEIDGKIKIYEVQEGDKLYFTVKKSYTDTVPVIQKVVHGGNVVHIEPEDTEGLDFGSNKYDVQLNTKDGDVYTVIGPAEFELLKEVT